MGGASGSAGEAAGWAGPQAQQVRLQGGGGRSLGLSLQLEVLPENHGPSFLIICVLTAKFLRHEKINVCPRRAVTYKQHRLLRKHLRGCVCVCRCVRLCVLGGRL